MLAQVRQVLEKVLRARAVQDRPGDLLRGDRAETVTIDSFLLCAVASRAIDLTRGRVLCCNDDDILSFDSTARVALNER